MSGLPATPYPDGTGGHSGSSTSRERAIRERDDGTLGRRQQSALSALGAAGQRGLTWRELGDLRDWHHGQASGVLSTLHQTGHITRLTERRDRCQVYVLPVYAEGRTEAPLRKRRTYEQGYEEGYADAMAVCRRENEGRLL